MFVKVMYFGCSFLMYLLFKNFICKTLAKSVNKENVAVVKIYRMFLHK